MVFVEDNNLIQCGRTTSDHQTISQKRDNSRATSNEMMYKTTDSKYLKLKVKMSASLKSLHNSTWQFATNLSQWDVCG